MRRKLRIWSVWRARSSRVILREASAIDVGDEGDAGRTPPAATGEPSTLLDSGSW